MANKVSYSSSTPAAPSGNVNVTWQVGSSSVPTVSGYVPNALTSLGFTPLNPANNLSELVSAASARTNLGLGSAATMASSAFQAALSITNDTNVTAALSGGVLTLGWAGTLAAGRLNASVVQSVVNDTNVTGSIAAQSLTLAWSGQLSIARGGTGQSTAAAGFNALSPLTTLGDLLYGGTSGTGTRLAGSTSAVKRFLTQTGTGSASAAPAWGVIAAADIPVLNQNTTGTAANVTGVVGIANGGSGQTTAAAALTAFGGASLTASNAFTGSTQTFTGTLAIAGTSVRQQLSVGAYLDIYSNVNPPGSQTTNTVRGAGSYGLVLSAYSSGSVFLNYDGGTGGVLFCNGAQSTVASVSSTGAASFTSVVSSGAMTQGPVSLAGVGNYFLTNSANAASTTLLNPGLLLYSLSTAWGLDLGYSSTAARYRTRVFASTAGDVALSTSGAALPTAQSGFTDWLVVTGSTGAIALNGAVTLGAGLNLNGQTVSGAATFSGALTFNSSVLGSFGGWQTWTPAISAYGSMTVSGVTITEASCLRIGPMMFVKLNANFTLGGTASNVVSVGGLPLSNTGSGTTCQMILSQGGNSSFQPAVVSFASGGASMFVQVAGQVAFTLGVQYLQLEGFYQCA